MMKSTSKIITLVVSAGLLLAGCAGAPFGPSGTASPPPPQSSVSSAYGTVDSIQLVPSSSGNTSGAGTVLGGVAGGLLGNQVGSGSGRTAATVAGAVGGAVVGNQIEQRNRVASGGNLYQVRVRLDNGSYQTITQDNVNDLRVGSRVRIDNDRAYPY
jgi:outer membrane lipoprotein SlyB